MSWKPLIVTLILIVGSRVLGETLTPFPTGQQVEITTSAETLIGTLQDSPLTDWIAVLPAGADRAIYVPVSAVQHIRASAGSVAPSGSRWKLRSKHLIHGFPVPMDDRYNFTPPGETEIQPGVSILVREGFAVGHCDRFKVPLWVSMRWTEYDYDQSKRAPEYGRPFREDRELPTYARAGISYDYSTSRMQRGHMARHQDNAAWGQDNSRAGCLMSNIAPQHRDLNGADWLDLENAHRNIVDDAGADIDMLWIISGTVFLNTTPQAMVGNDIGVPYGTYKVIGWYDQSDQFHARGYLLKQTDRRNRSTHYLTPIDEIEEMTGLDFFPELDETMEKTIEAAEYRKMW